MRYYAGNWPYGVWLFRGDSYRKLERLTKSSPWVYDQLDRFYDHETSVGMVGKVMGFRLMHLHGRALSVLIPKAVERFQDYEYVDGEIVAGLVLGWNFGDGHLHNEPLLQSVQQQCGFEEGELRCIFVESQPLGRSTLEYRILDAKTGADRSRTARSCSAAPASALGERMSAVDVVIVGSGPNGAGRGGVSGPARRLGLGARIPRAARRGHAHGRVDAAGLLARRMFGRASDGCALAVFSHVAAGGPRLALDSPTGVRGSSLGRKACRDIAAVAGRNGRRTGR